MQTSKKRCTFVLSLLFLGSCESIQVGIQSGDIHRNNEVVNVTDPEGIEPQPKNQAQQAAESQGVAQSERKVAKHLRISFMETLQFVSLSIGIICGCCVVGYLLSCSNGSEGEDENSQRSWRQTCFLLLNGSDTGYSCCGRDPSTFVTLVVMLLIVANVGFVLFESADNKSLPIYAVWYRRLEEFSLVLFTIEYSLRFWCSVEDEKFKTADYPRLSFATSTFPLIDLMALLPFAYDLYGPPDQNIKGATFIRLFRVFSLLRLESKVRSFARVFKVLRSKGEELLVTLFTAVIMLIVSASMIFYLESEAQPDKFPSIVASMWWACAALTTVGYGDIYPVTTGGKVMACFVAFIGIGFFALPAGIIGSGFVETMIEEKQAASEADAVHRAVKALRGDKPQEALKILEEELNVLVEKLDHL